MDILTGPASEQSLMCDERSSLCYLNIGYAD